MSDKAHLISLWDWPISLSGLGGIILLDVFRARAFGKRPSDDQSRLRRQEIDEKKNHTQRSNHFQ